MGGLYAPIPGIFIPIGTGVVTGSVIPDPVARLVGVFVDIRGVKAPSTDPGVEPARTSKVRGARARTHPAPAEHKARGGFIAAWGCPGLNPASIGISLRPFRSRAARPVDIRRKRDQIRRVVPGEIPRHVRPLPCGCDRRESSSPLTLRSRFRIAIPPFRNPASYTHNTFTNRWPSVVCNVTMPYTIDDPDDGGKKDVNGDGRLYLGDRYAGQRVEYAVKILDEDEDEE